MSKTTMPTRDEINSAIESQEWVVMGKLLRRIADALADSVVVPREPVSQEDLIGLLECACAMMDRVNALLAKIREAGEAAMLAAAKGEGNG